MNTNINGYSASDIAIALVNFGMQTRKGKADADVTPLKVSARLPHLTMHEISASLGGTVKVGERSYSLPTIQEVYSEMARKRGLLGAIYLVATDPRHPGDETQYVWQTLLGPRKLLSGEAERVRNELEVLDGWIEYMGTQPGRIKVEFVKSEFLPRGRWLSAASGESGEVAPAPQSTPNRKGSRADMGRLSFLGSLVSLEEMVVFDGVLGSRGGRKYRAYVVKREGGCRLALLDAPEKGNALYVFDADHPDWKSTAQLSKHKVLRGGHKAFLRRILHTRHWQQHVREMVQS